MQGEAVRVLDRPSSAMRDGKDPVISHLEPGQKCGAHPEGALLLQIRKHKTQNTLTIVKGWSGKESGTHCRSVLAIMDAHMFSARPADPETGKGKDYHCQGAVDQGHYRAITGLS